MMQTSQSSSTGRGASSPRGAKAGQLNEEFRDRGRVGSDGALLLWSTDAIELVNRAADEGAPIVRITCVAPTAAVGGAAVDAREQRVDFSREVCDGHGCWEAAEAFVRRRGELGLLFNVELGDDPLQIV